MTLRGQCDGKVVLSKALRSSGRWALRHERLASPAKGRHHRRVEFEFDPRKSESNKAKHGIDFDEAQALWKAKHVILGARDTTEKRYLVIGEIGRDYWSAIITYRGATIRIISVRKSTQTEIDVYVRITR
jgi:uncharacterized DUF497 family protein